MGLFNYKATDICNIMNKIFNIPQNSIYMFTKILSLAICHLIAEKKLETLEPITETEIVLPNICTLYLRFEKYTVQVEKVKLFSNFKHSLINAAVEGKSDLVPELEIKLIEQITKKFKTLG